MGYFPFVPTNILFKTEMEVETKKISTSGWKGSRNDAYKKKQAKLKHKKSSLVFSRKRK